VSNVPESALDGMSASESTESQVSSCFCNVHVFQNGIKYSMSFISVSSNAGSSVYIKK